MRYINKTKTDIMTTETFNKRIKHLQLKRDLSISDTSRQMWGDKINKLLSLDRVQITWL